MPKVASSINNKVAAYLKEFPNETFQSDGKVLYCKYCEKSVSIGQRFSTGTSSFERCEITAVKKKKECEHTNVYYYRT